MNAEITRGEFLEICPGLSFLRKQIEASEEIKFDHLSKPILTHRASIAREGIMIGLSIITLIVLDYLPPITESLKNKSILSNPISADAFGSDPNYLRVWGSLITEVSADQPVVEATPIPKPAWIDNVILETPEYDKNKKPIKQTILNTAKKYDVPAGLLSALLWWESEQFNQDVIDVKRKSPSGAEGIAQFMPQTAKRFGVITKDPVSSIDGAGRYLQFLYNYLGKKWDLALAGYNSGEGTVKWWGKVPPYWETQKYVKVITEKYQSIEAPRK